MGSGFGDELTHLVGMRIGEMLGKRVFLGGCQRDIADDLEERPFRSQLADHQVPPGVDLRAWMTPVENQGDIGSCTSNALASAVEYLVRRQTGATVDVSRLFLYYNQRLFTGEVRRDNGASIRLGVRVLSRLGIPHEKSWPYDPNLFAVQPPEPVYRAAFDHRIVDWSSIACDHHALRACLAGGFPVVFGLAMFPACFEAAGRTGRMPMPSADQRPDGAHAMLLVGYHDAERVYIVRNSWGTEWGDRGYCAIPYELVTNPEFAHGFWCVRLAADVTFEEAEHGRVDVSQLPHARPRDQTSGSADAIATLAGLTRGSTGALGLAAGLLSSNAPRLLGALTGNARLGNFLGGLVRGVVPAMLEARGTDAGETVGPDRSQEILAVLRGPHIPSAPGTTRAKWDDGLDEESVAR